MRMIGCAAATAALVMGLAVSRAEGLSPGDLRSGFEDMSRENQALQRDDTANPAMLWVGEGAGPVEPQGGTREPRLCRLPWRGAGEHARRRGALSSVR
jgi:sulfur-oxidizing protein SoxA